jgi:hypothetical protein
MNQMRHLSLPDQNFVYKEVSKDVVDVKVLVLYPFYVEADANGNSFNITKDDVKNIHDKYNSTVRFKWARLKKMGKEIPLNLVENAPNQLDHVQSAIQTVGHVIGEMELIELNTDPHLFANIRVKGKDNVERVKDGRFNQVSIGFDPITHEVFEISWVVRGAIPGAQRVLSKVYSTSVTKDLEYNTTNLTHVKSLLLSKYENNRKLIDEKENEAEISIMLTSLMADGKILPKDKERIKIELSRISDKETRFSAFNLLANNLRNVIDYSTRSRNHLSLSLEESLMAKGDNVLDLSNIAARSAILLKKGHKKAHFEEKESDDENMKEKGRIEKSDKKEEKEAKEFSKKDLEHCMSLSEDKEELKSYLSAFLSEDDEEDMDEKSEKKEEKEKAKFSVEIQKIKQESIQLKKQNSEILEQIALLSKGTEEARALFSKIVELHNTSAK